MRISRPCYDKYRRCPGWAGGGMHFAKIVRCDNGYINIYNGDKKKPLWKWRFHKCNKCDVWVLPYNLVRFFPANLKSNVRHRFWNFQIWYQDRKDGYK